MEIVIGAEACEVVDGGNLRALSVRVAEGATVPTTVGAPDDDGSHVWVNIAWLRDAATMSAAPDDVASFHSDFAGMIGYAAKSGWVSGDGAKVRAHIA